MKQASPAYVGPLIKALAVWLIGCISFGVILGLYVILTGDPADPLMRIISLLSIALGHLCLALMGAMVMRKNRLIPLMWLQIGCSAAAMMMWTVLLFGDLYYKTEEKAAMAGASLVIVAIITVHTGLLTVMETKSPALHWMKLIIIFGAWLFALMVISMIWTADALENQLPQVWMIIITYTIAGLGLAELVGTMIVSTLIRRHAKKRVEPGESIARKITLELSCPKCSADMSTVNGPARCAACGFTMMIEIEEPRCDCGYLLYQLTGDVCPECGQSIPPEMRWGQAEATTIN